MNEILGRIDREALIELLFHNLGEKRTQHVLSVERKTLELCQIYNVDEIQGRTAALYHDFAKRMSLEESIGILEKYNYPYDGMEAKSMDLLHSKVAGVLAQHRYDIKNKSVIEAIMYHTTGRAGMGVLAKIIFIADAIEESRKYPKVETYREIAKKDLDKALQLILDGQIIFLINEKKVIHPDTVHTRNYLLS